MIDIRSFKSNTCNEAVNAKTFIYKIVFYSDLSKLLQDGRTTASLKICIQDQGHCHFLNSFCASYYNTTYLLGRPNLDCFGAHYFLALLGHNQATLKRKLLKSICNWCGQGLLAQYCGLNFSPEVKRPAHISYKLMSNFLFRVAYLWPKKAKK